MRFETLAIHAGQKPDPATGAVTVPVHQTSTFQQTDVGVHRGYEYSRTGNPTRAALERALAAVEGGTYGLAFASGCAAAMAVFSLVRPGDRVVCCDDVYGGTYRILERIVRRSGVDVVYVPATEIAAYEKALTPNARLVWVETPTNPLLRVVDLRALSAVAAQRGALLAVDSTFASPYLQRPLEHGADIVVHSTTKYIAGHSDVVGGAVITNDKAVFDALRFYQNAAGAVPGMWDTWLVLRGLKTLSARMRDHCYNAVRIAQLMSAHPAVSEVFYPGLSIHPDHATAQRQMTGFGGIVTAKLVGGYPAVRRFIHGLSLFTLAESLGGVESLVCCPARMTHASIAREERERRGITEDLVRLSVGIEDADDLESDVRRALECAASPDAPTYEI